MKKVLKMGVMAAFVAAALSGCEQAPDEVMVYGSGTTQESFTVSSPDQCTSLGVGDAKQCSMAFDVAKAEHEKNAPRYGNNQSCEESAGVSCQEVQVQNPDGSMSSMFMPLMAGMVIGNLMNGFSHPRPVYADRHDRDRRVTSGGTYVPTGKGYVGSNTFTNKSSGFSKPNTATKLPSKTMISKSSGFKSGGFGATGRGSNGGG